MIRCEHCEHFHPLPKPRELDRHIVYGYCGCEEGDGVGYPVFLVNGNSGGARRGFEEVVFCAEYERRKAK